MPRHWLSFSTPLNCGFAFTSFREVNDDGIHTEVRKDEVCNLLRLYSLFCDVSEWCWGQVELQSMSEVNDVGTLGDLNCQDCIMKAGVTWRSIIWHVTQWQPISCKWLRQDCAFMLVDNAAKDLQLQHQQINEPMIEASNLPVSVQIPIQTPKWASSSSMKEDAASPSLIHDTMARK